MEQIYKNLYKDDEGRYVFATDEDTRYVVDQQSYILIYILEMIMKLDNSNENMGFMLNPAEKAKDE